MGGFRPRRSSQPVDALGRAHIENPVARPNGAYRMRICTNESMSAGETLPS
jgi:hypothetical protein